MKGNLGNSSNLPPIRRTSLTTKIRRITTAWSSPPRAGPLMPSSGSGIAWLRSAATIFFAGRK